MNEYFSIHEFNYQHSNVFLFTSIFFSLSFVAVHLGCVFLAHYNRALSFYEVFREISSDYLHRSARRGRLGHSNLRQSFSDLPNLRSLPAVNHTHPDCAKDRSDTSAFIDLYCSSTGYDAYYVQMSLSDQRNERRGSRSYYWSKDFTVKPLTFDPRVGDLLAFVDVDQYIDMPSLLAWKFSPALIHTFQPRDVAAIRKDYSYKFKSNNVLYTVNGGGCYTHPVWHYGQDSMLVYSKFLGIPYRCASYLVDRRKTSDDHELILMTPVAQWSLIGTLLSYFIHGSGLQRLCPSAGRFNRLVVQSSTGLDVSLSIEDSYAVATIPAVKDDTLASIARSGKLDLTLPQVLGFVDGDKSQAAILLEYHREKVGLKSPFVFPITHSVRNYQFSPENFEPEAPPAVVPFMNPFMDGCYAPQICLANEHRAIQERVVKVASKDIELTPFLAKVIHEYVVRLIPVSHKAHPYEDDVVHARQNKPSQRRILKDAEFSDPVAITQSFLKRETYQKPNDPRVISQINSSDKLDYSRFIYVVADLLKEQPWYAFGKTPAEVAAAVAAVCERALQVVLSDLSRFDGRVSNLLRELERQVLLRLFDPIYHEEVLNLHRRQRSCRGYGKFGTKYFSNKARLSGSPETTAFNSIADSFIAFLANRITVELGTTIFRTADQSWSMLGIYGGDDGISPNIEADAFKRAAEMVGQVSTTSVILRGKSGVMFLARIYSPDVWFGDSNSMCDLQRQLLKFHTTVHLPDTILPTDKLIEKARAFFLTDKFTPVIGEYVTTVMCHTTSETLTTNYLNIWQPYADLPTEDQYPNVRADWMINHLKETLPGFSYEKFIDWLDNTYTLEGLLHVPLCCESPDVHVTETIVVNGEVVDGDDDPWKKPWTGVPLTIGPDPADKSIIPPRRVLSLKPVVNGPKYVTPRQKRRRDWRARNA